MRLCKVRGDGSSDFWEIKQRNFPHLKICWFCWFFSTTTIWDD